MRRISTLILAAFVLALAAPAFAGGAFSDVPSGHWAYKAIEKAVEAGILQGYDGKFHGNKTLNRYQMAVVVARMLDRIETMGPGKVGKKDIENLEALTIEFADELALLNVKVSTLEDGFAEVKKDMEGLKKEFAGGGAKAGISGLFQGRMVVTDDDATRFSNRAAAGPFAATAPLSRYGAGAIAGAAAPGASESRTFFNVAQASVGFDRHFDEDYYLHVQLDFNADNENAAFGGGSLDVQVNEAYVDLEKWLADGDARVRVGSWALPFARERNPEMVEYPNQLRYGYRSLDLTISPAFWDASWEGVRNVGVGLWNGKDNGFQWQAAVTNNTNPNGAKDGSLLAYRLNGFAAGNTTAIAGSVLGDSLASIDSNGSGAGVVNNMGYYGWVGDKYDGGLRWDAGYFQNGGNLFPGAGENGTANEWRGFQFNAGWWGWEDWGFMASYYNATSDSRTLAAGGAAGAAGGSRHFTGTALFPALTAAQIAAGLTYPDVDSTSWSLLANYKFNDDNNISVRYEDLEDTMGVAEITARVWTFGWNHRVSSNSLLQLEYSTPESDTQSAAVVGGAVVATPSTAALPNRNTIDANDDLIQLNYKVKF